MLQLWMPESISGSLLISTYPMMPSLVFLFFHFLISVASSLEKFSSWAEQTIEIDILELKEGEKSYNEDLLDQKKSNGLTLWKTDLLLYISVLLWSTVEYFTCKWQYPWISVVSMTLALEREKYYQCLVSIQERVLELHCQFDFWKYLRIDLCFWKQKWDQKWYG